MTKNQLFLTVNHPSNYLLEYLFNITCDYISKKYLNEKFDIFRNLNIKLGNIEILDDYTLFVHPEVIKSLGLEFTPYPPKVKGKLVTYSDLIEKHP